MLDLQSFCSSALANAFLGSCMARPSMAEMATMWPTSPSFVKYEAYNEPPQSKRLRDDLKVIFGTHLQERILKATAKTEAMVMKKKMRQWGTINKQYQLMVRPKGSVAISLQREKVRCDSVL